MESTITLACHTLTPKASKSTVDLGRRPSSSEHCGSFQGEPLKLVPPKRLQTAYRPPKDGPVQGVLTAQNRPALQRYLHPSTETFPIQLADENKIPFIDGNGTPFQAHHRSTLEESKPQMRAPRYLSSVEQFQIPEYWRGLLESRGVIIS